MSFLVFCLLFWVSGAGAGTQDPISVQDPGTPSLLESNVAEDVLEETCLPPSLVPHLAFADFAASVFAYFPSRRLLTPRLGWWFGHAPRALSLRCFRVRLPHAALSVRVGCHAATSGFVPVWAAVF